MTSGRTRDFLFSLRGRAAVTLLGITLLGMTPAAASATGEPRSGHEQIRQAVLSHLAQFFDESGATENGGRAEIDVSRLDPRLQIDLCARPLLTSLNRQQEPLGRVTVRVECPATAGPWTRYIQAEVRVYEPVVVSSRMVSRGERLTEADVTLQEVEISGLRSTVIRDPAQAVGMEVRRTVPAGTALSDQTLTAPVLIERGDTVVITAERGAVSIRHQGVALQDGVMGKRINIRNSRSERVIQARVTGTGQAAVEF